MHQDEGLHDVETGRELEEGEPDFAIGGDGMAGVGSVAQRDSGRDEVEQDKEMLLSWI